jgi:hypothetical protein
VSDQVSDQNAAASPDIEINPLNRSLPTACERSWFGSRSCNSIFWMEDVKYRGE